jgi:hypothetical protein
MQTTGRVSRGVNPTTGRVGEVREHVYGFCF